MPCLVPPVLSSLSLSQAVPPPPMELGHEPRLKQNLQAVVDLEIVSGSGPTRSSQA